jgi:purine-cytosine permease-like protein
MTDATLPERSGSGEDGVNVVPLGAEVADGHDYGPPPSPPSSRLHGLAIAGMALSALLGIGSMLAFVTVRWTGAAGRFIVAVVIVAAIGFLVCASAAVFTAARDMYAHRPRENAGEEQ